MPNVWTHILFGEKIAKKAGYDPAAGLEAYFRLGTQGPDPFFYHNFWPWKSTPVQEIGEKIHYTRCGQFLMEMIEYGKEHQHDTKLTAYTLGFITHHILDRNTHPYIIYRSGNEGNRHQKLEIIIDTLLMKKLRNIETWKTPVYEQIFVGKKLDHQIEQMLTSLVDRLFPGAHSRMPANYVQVSYQHMVKALKVLYDPSGWKNRILGNLISPFSYQKNFEEKDYLNEEKNTWLHPAVEKEENNASFYELMENAEDEGIEILELVLQYWKTNDTETRETLKEKIGNLSYDTGKDCTAGLENKHFEPIL
ncbi:zinc dependent phospholipase C family protein [Pseudalkalibacillus caeni]|uniref:Phospholipase C/D domain-containing protein n=1 Tax=Exobacillus caeni TaxID=2574798 RepID=A0A5R9FAC1_9BACL|nr:zinc dependent phospholipase C family protein [Pseudalkalibacillus caeni]TLS36585.1 hypothetical protein FCL54_13745 [Pseudalkalibacillus caeni]